MNKAYILATIKYQGNCEKINLGVTRIEDTLSAIPSDVDLGAMTSVENFEKSGKFGLFEHPESTINCNDEKERILSDLKSILTELASWIRENPLQAKYTYIASKQANGKLRRKIMTALLVGIAAVAIVLYCLQAREILDTSANISEIIGLVDLVLGIGGWIYELADDGKNEAVCGAIQKIGESEDEDLLTKTDHYIKAKNRNVILCLFNFGTIQQIERQENVNRRE